MKNIIILISYISLLLSYHVADAMVVLEIPEVVAAQNTLVCTGTSAKIELTATITNEVTGSISYQWTGPNGFTSTEQNPEVSASSANAGTYNVSVTSNEGQGTASVEVEVYDVLPAASIDGPEIVCEGESFTLCISDFKDYPGNPFTLSAENSTASQSSILEIDEKGCVTIDPGDLGHDNGTFTVEYTYDNGCQPEESIPHEVIYPSDINEYNIVYDIEYNCDEITTCSDQGYANELCRRFTDINNSSKWLSWDASINEGKFDLQKLITQIIDETNGISDTANNGGPNYIVLNDKDFYAWEHVRPKSSDTKYTYFILTPGDYRDYSIFRPGDKLGSDTKYLLHYPYLGEDIGSITAEQIRDYYDYDDSDIKPKSAEEQYEHELAIIEGFKLEGADVSNWVIKGITIRGNRNSRLDDENQIYLSGSSTSIITNSDNNIIESCLFENQARGNYLNIGNSDNNIIHNCVIRNQTPYNLTYLGGNDIIGIRLGATFEFNKELSKGTIEASENNVIINNQIYNVTDAIHLVRDARSIGNAYQNGDRIGDLPGTLIYNNVMYNERVFIDQCGEERMNGEGAIDIKQGVGDAGLCNEILPQSVSICKKVIIAKNTFHGWRRAGKDGLGRIFGYSDEDVCESQDDYCSSAEGCSGNLYQDPKEGDCWNDSNGQGGGSGEAITCHNNARNIVIMDNSVYDCTNGFIVAAGAEQTGWVGYIEIYNNKICNLYPSYCDYSDLKNDASGYWTGSAYSSGNICTELPQTPNHSLGRAIRVNTRYSCTIDSNIIANTLDGVYLSNANISPTVTNNFFQNVALQSFNNGPSYENFNYNHFVNSCYVHDDEVLLNSDGFPSSSTGNENCPVDYNCGSSCASSN